MYILGRMVERERERDREVYILGRMVERERDREVCILGRMVEREIERCVY